MIELDFLPGGKFGYSNSGYALLTSIIEMVSGTYYKDYIQEQVCDPLGMYNTGCDDGIKIVSGLASGYSFWEEPIHPAYADLSFPLGAYGLYSTTEDLLVWDKALNTSQLLSNEMTEIMFTPYLNSYSCGWITSEIIERKCVNHSGDISGFFSDFLRFTDDQATVIFLSNMSVTPVTHLSREIAKIIFKENVNIPCLVDPVHFENGESIKGEYILESDSKIVLDISIKNNELFISVPKMYGILYKFKLIPIYHSQNKTIFKTEMINEQLSFFYSQSGAIERIEYTDYNGIDQKIKRLTKFEEGADII